MDHFWLKTPLARMTHSQWETLCDGCGRCCLQKLKNPSTGKVYYTWVACYLLDLQTCRCSDYAMRHVLVADCIELGPANIASLYWMPGTCAYRLVAQGKDLPDWHPLVSGDPGSVHAAGISVRHKAISEVLVHPDDIEDYIIGQRF
ncbi:MAG: YcgN family cysteine cluster protein [Desulfosarcinaceae bacterium]